jgi:hypothetical protein
MPYTRVDPYLFFSGKVGHIEDELGLADVQDSNRNARIMYSPTGGPLGEGGWTLYGGNQGGDCCVMTQEASYPVSDADLVTTMCFRLEAVHTAVGFRNIMVGVTDGDAGNMAAEKPSILLDQDRNLYLGSSNARTWDELLRPLTLDVVYFVVLHGRGGAAGDLTHEAWLYDENGNELAAKQSAWAVGNTGSNDVCKWGNSGGGDTTNLILHFAHMGVYKGVSTNPGPCEGYVKRPISTIAPGNSTAFGAPTQHEATDDPAAGSRLITDLASTAADTTITSAASANFSSPADVGAAFRNHPGVTNTSRRIASVTSATEAELDSATGVSTSAAAAAVLHRRSNDNDTTYAVFASAAASTLEMGLSADDVPDGDEVHTVICEAIQRHTGSGPTVQLGVKSGATSELLTLTPTSTVSFNRRRGATSNAATAPSHSLDPATGARWTPAAANAVTALVRDNDALNREFRITSLRVVVVAAKVPAAGGIDYPITGPLDLLIAGQERSVLITAEDRSMDLSGMVEREIVVVSPDRSGTLTSVDRDVTVTSVVERSLEVSGG